MAKKQLASSKVKVFPSAFRGKNTSNNKQYDPGSFLTLEENFVNLANKVTYKIPNYCYEDSSYVHIILQGYHFAALKTDVKSLYPATVGNEEIWAGISTGDLQMSAYDNANTNTLKPDGGTPGELLDNQDVFTALVFGASEADLSTCAYKICIYKYSNADYRINPESALNISSEQIKNGSTSLPITEQFDTSKIYANQILTKFTSDGTDVLRIGHKSASGQGVTQIKISANNSIELSTGSNLTLTAGVVSIYGETTLTGSTTFSGTASFLGTTSFSDSAYFSNVHASGTIYASNISGLTDDVMIQAGDSSNSNNVNLSAYGNISLYGSSSITLTAYNDSILLSASKSITLSGKSSINLKTSGVLSTVANSYYISAAGNIDIGTSAGNVVIGTGAGDVFLIGGNAGSNYVAMGGMFDAQSLGQQYFAINGSGIVYDHGLLRLNVYNGYTPISGHLTSPTVDIQCYQPNNSFIEYPLMRFNSYPLNIYEHRLMFDYYYNGSVQGYMTVNLMLTYPGSITTWNDFGKALLYNQNFLGLYAYGKNHYSPAMANGFYFYSQGNRFITNVGLSGTLVQSPSNSTYAVANAAIYARTQYLYHIYSYTNVEAIWENNVLINYNSNLGMGFKLISDAVYNLSAASIISTIKSVSLIQ